ncbi:MAG: hypothetical protein JHC31_10930 [Sulfurihydrogenibium sp.]|nr:hypothetical protein [Sulfurihydrogenibium sp.]
MTVEIQAQAKPIITDLASLPKLDNFEMLEMFGMIIKSNSGQCKLSDKIVVLKDDDAPAFVGMSKIFPLSDIFSGAYFTSEELRKALKDKEEDLRYLRVYLSYFNYQEDGRLSQKQDYWFKFKAWRYDIDDVNYTLEQVLELINKLPLKPNIIKKSNKGWHLIYVFDRFIERQDVEAYRKNRNDKDYIPYMVYEILTNLLPIYLKELEPKLDVGASNNISKIATRFISEKLPAYVINPEYSLETFLDAYVFLTKQVFSYDYEEVSGDLEKDLSNGKKSIYTINDIPEEVFYDATSNCGVLKAIDEDWENHSYYDWFLMINIYAVKCLYAKNQEELEKIKREFHEKSSRYPNYKYQEAEYFLNKAIEYQREGLKLPGCKFINENISSKYLDACKSCPYKRVDKKGNIYSHYLFTYLNRDNLEDEDITVKGWELKRDGWHKYNPEDGSYTQVLPYFKIRTHYFVKNDEFVEIVDKEGKAYVMGVDRNKNTYKPYINLVRKFGKVNTDKIKEGERFLAQYIEEVKAKRGIKIDFVGYRYRGIAWDIVVGGYGKYTRKEILFILHPEIETDDIESVNWYIPEVKGSEERFKAVYNTLFYLDDAPLHLTIAHFLSWIGWEFLKDDGFYRSLNPILAIIGDTGTGKSIRVKIATALYGKPYLYSFTGTTQAGYSNNFHKIKTPFGVDEVIIRSEKDVEKINAFYNTSNMQGKLTAYNTYDPVIVPTVLTGETQNFLIDRITDINRGLNRRFIVIKLSDKWKGNAEILGEALDELQENYGHILSYVRSLEEKDKKDIKDLAKGIQARLNFGDSIFYDLKKHLALSLAMFYHFYEKYIGINAEMVADKVNAVIDFVVKQINKNQASKIGENIDYAEEILKFINKVVEALRNGKELKGGFETVCNAINYSTTKSVEKYLKKFFWRNYGNGKKYVFNLSVLITNPYTPLASINSDKDSIISFDRKVLSNLTDEELKIWAEVFDIIYGENKEKTKIVAELGDERLKKILKIDDNTKKDKAVEDEEVEY